MGENYVKMRLFPGNGAASTRERSDAEDGAAVADGGETAEY